MAKNRIKLKKYLAIFAGFIALIIICTTAINLHVNASTKDLIKSINENLPYKTTGIILGAKVHPDGQLSHMLEDRVLTTIELYKNGTISKILISGDHGRTNYDEVNTIRKFLQSRNVKAEDIFLDHAGFDTYDSMYRARDIFKIDNAIIVTQEFHLPRAIYISSNLGLDTYGVIADKRPYLSTTRSEIREIPANVKAFLDITFHAQPKFLGETIPITGDSKKSWDME